MTAPLDLDAINEELAGAGCLRPRTAAKVLAEVERLRADLSLNVGLVGKLSNAYANLRDAWAESVPRSSLVQVGWWHESKYDSWIHQYPDADGPWPRRVRCSPIYVIREDTDA